jgi:hypothetical protein
VFAVIGSTPLRNAIGAVIFGYDELQINAWPLVVLDWSLACFDGVTAWARDLSQQVRRLTVECGALNPTDTIFVEPDGIGSSLAAALYESGHTSVEEVPEPFAALTLQERAIASTAYVARSLVIMSRPAYEKESTFQDVTRNHLMSQITSVSITGEDPECCELFSAWSVGVILALDTSPRAKAKGAK